ncbi:MAG TPA: DUF192 domain-containing protein [Acidimicrobiales bacterium]|nr:DUF192 domain-containing protein [Acidimicrobiales bacterium]
MSDPAESEPVTPDPLVDRPALLDSLPVVRDLETPRLERLLRSSVWTLLFLGVGACMVQGAQRPPDPDLSPEFGTISFKVTNPAGQLLPSEFCALHARTARERQQGMRGKSDQAGHDGMVFAFEAAGLVYFENKDVPIALHIAWFDQTGAFVSAAEMPSCLQETGCPTYTASAPFTLAIETPVRGLEALQIGPGSRVELGRRGCTPRTPPAPAAPPAG